VTPLMPLMCSISLHVSSLTHTHSHTLTHTDTHTHTPTATHTYNTAKHTHTDSHTDPHALLLLETVLNSPLCVYSSRGRGGVLRCLLFPLIKLLEVFSFCKVSFPL